ncbi:TPA: GIY-YIG nuclease family protein [bacterium]|nr:GIY-YIG nuclease family protein [bacterium]
MTSGIYQLLIYLPYKVDIEIGKLGRFQFKSGYYVYTGSAMNGLESRITRHKRKQKRLHWHIDYLLEYAEIIDAVTYPTKDRLECAFNNRILLMQNCQIPVKYFGSSDCNCITHLLYFEEKPNIAP